MPVDVDVLEVWVHLITVGKRLGRWYVFQVHVNGAVGL